MIANGTARRRRPGPHLGPWTAVLVLLIATPHLLAALAPVRVQDRPSATRCCCGSDCHCTGPCCDHGDRPHDARRVVAVTSDEESLANGNPCQGPFALVVFHRTGDHAKGALHRRSVGVTPASDVTRMAAPDPRRASGPGPLDRAPARAPPHADPVVSI